MRGASLELPSSRVRLLCALLLFGLVLLAARAAHLTVLDSRGRGWGELQAHTTLRIPAPRGLIVDRDGVELAVTVQAPSVYVIPTEIADPAKTAAALAGILGGDPVALAEQLAARTRFTFVERWTTREEAARVRALELPGVGIVKEPRRAYPAGALAGPVLGFANIDGEGSRGIEQQEEATLRGRERVVGVERDARGRLLVVDPSLPRDTAGGDVRLTLDAALQAAAEGALAAEVERTGARGGFVVTLDPATGDILSLAESPGIDPNVFRELDFASTRSRAFLDAFEPGSTLKAIVVAGALDEGVVRPAERIDTGVGRLRVPGKTIRDRHAYGEIEVGDVLRVSSNVGAVLIGQRLDRERHYEVLRRFGFGATTGSGFPQESAGVLRDWREWKPVDHATICFGQGINVTPIQLAAAFSALANGGVWRAPRLVAARRPAGGDWEPQPLGRKRRAVGSEAAAQTLQMLERVVSATGTGRRAALRGLRVAGKTGTAQKFDTEAGRYSRSRTLAWFAGVVPADAPRLAIVVALDEPRGRANGGGDTAAPVFAQVAAAQLAHLGIVTVPEPIPAERFPTLVAEAETPAPSESKQQKNATPPAKTRAPEIASRVVASEATPEPAPERSQGPKALEQTERKEEGSAQAEPAGRRTSVAVAEALPGEAALPQVSAAPGRTVLVPDFRGETLDSALRMAAAEALELELTGDARGLAVEQHPHPGSIVTGERPRVRLRFTLGTEEG